MIIVIIIINIPTGAFRKQATGKCIGTTIGGSERFFNPAGRGVIDRPLPPYYSGTHGTDNNTHPVRGKSERYLGSFNVIRE
jgi:hypothetical protein